jgi:hypothetical protein
MILDFIPNGPVAARSRTHYAIGRQSGIDAFSGLKATAQQALLRKFLVDGLIDFGWPPFGGTPWPTKLIRLT